MRELDQRLALDVFSGGTALRSGLRAATGWRKVPDGFCDRAVISPGWRRFQRASTWITARAVLSALMTLNAHGPTAVIYTLPFYAGVARRTRGRGHLQVYYVHDSFRGFGWGGETVVRLERELVAACDGVIAVSTSLADDMRELGAHRLLVSPNAAEDPSVVNADAASVDVPVELLTLNRPILGCVGNISTSYDWDLLMAVARDLPRATLVMIGGIIDSEDSTRRRMAELQHYPNVVWLGPKPHRELPRYIAGFDVCLNPLRVTDHNIRRSPLRIYDYLALGRPVVSTMIPDAIRHADWVEPIEAPERAADAILKVLADSPSRRAGALEEYMRQNTWAARGEAIAQWLRTISNERRGG